MPLSDAGPTERHAAATNFVLTNTARAYMLAGRMRARPRPFIVATLCACAAACSDATGSNAFVTLCPGPATTWAGIEREGGSWQSIPSTQGTFPLNEGERIGLARLREPSLEIYYVTAEQAEATFACDPPPTKQLHGTVRGIGTAFTSQATISMGTSRAVSAAQGAENFTLSRAPNGSTDLVATAYDVGPATIIRRGVDYPNGSTIPVLDFGSSEAFSLEVNTVTVNGTSDYEFSATNEFITQKGTQAMLRYSFTNSGTTLPMYSVPVSKMLDGELNSSTILGAFGREARVFYRGAADRTVDLGPRASVPVVTRSGTAPNRAMRIDAASQPEYEAHITFMLCAVQSALQPTITATREYFGGTPATWSVTVPDLKAVQDFPQSWPDPRLSGLCGVNVTDRPYLFSTRTARDGDGYRSALGPGVIYTP